MAKARNEVAPAELADQEIEKLVEELESDAPTSDLLSDEEIEKKYDTGQSRIIIQRNDFLVPNILELVKNREILNLSPSYQRRVRWPEDKRSHLIESLLMNVPIPPIFLYESDLARYEVMDGQQRLDTIRTFFNNEFKLKDLKYWPELNGRIYSELPSKIQSGLRRRGLAAVIILTESGQQPEVARQLRQYVFEKLNTGGQSLNAQEIRNCIYASPFNDLLGEISRSSEFTSIWGIPPREPGEPQHISKKLRENKLFSMMADCEIVLRYFALKDLEKFRSGMKLTLDRFMGEMRDCSESECKPLGREYLATLKLAREIFENKLFRLPRKDGELLGRRSVPLSDAVLVSLSMFLSKSDNLRNRKEQLVQDTKNLLSNADAYEKVVGRGNTKAAIEERILIFKTLFTDHAF